MTRADQTEPSGSGLPSGSGAQSRVVPSLYPPTGDGGAVGVIVVDHGSRRTEANARHESFITEWSTTAPFAVVEPAHMELAEPSIGTAFDRCVAAGATTVVVAPYFLWPGNHWSIDIPALVERAAASHPGIRYVVTAPLGPHPSLLDIVQQRVDHCLAHAEGRGPACDVCADTGGCALHSRPEADSR